MSREYIIAVGIWALLEGLRHYVPGDAAGLEPKGARLAGALKAMDRGAPLAKVAKDYTLGSRSIRQAKVVRGRCPQAWAAVLGQMVSLNTAWTQLKRR